MYNIKIECIYHVHIHCIHIHCTCTHTLHTQFYVLCYSAQVYRVSFRNLVMGRGKNEGKGVAGVEFRGVVNELIKGRGGANSAKVGSKCPSPPPP